VRIAGTGESNVTQRSDGSAKAAASAASGALLEVADAGRSFSGVAAVAHAGLSVQRGHIHGLIGPNGAGKTTLVNIISGHIRPDTGTVRWSGRDITRMRPEQRARLGMARTFQDTRLLEGLTVRDNLWLGSDLRRRIERGNAADLDPSPIGEQAALLELLGLNTRLEAVVGDLSSGERKGVEVGRALMAGAALILLDEPFSGLTSAEVDTMLTTLRNIRAADKCSMLLVEHNLGAVFDVCDTVTAMDKGAVLLSGPTEEVRRSPAVRRAFFGDEIVADLGSSTQLSTAAATAAVRAAAAEASPAPAASAANRTALEIHDLRAGYGRLTVVHGVSLSVGRGEIVGLIGANGAGKTTLLRALMGLATITGGSVVVEGERVAHSRDRVDASRIALCTQTRDLFVSLTVEDNLRLGARAVSDSKGATKQRLDEVLGMLPALRPLLRKEASALSGGQQQLLAVARALMSSPRVLLLDEPSTGLAVGTLSVLGESLLSLTADGLAVLVAEQNAGFASSVCSRGYVIENGQLAAEGAHHIFARAWEVTVTTTSAYTDAHQDLEAGSAPPAPAY
jgi:ABC-type branched-subunit amino acid transport system ATPase component